MRIGLVGKPNVGKSTFFQSATLAEAEIGNYPFTTIEANRGMAHVRVPDPGPDLGVVSTPRSGKIIGTTRYVPVELIDVAGLVPGAHEGRGLGNKFLGDLAQADALLHIVDASGQTDPEGNPLPAATHDPLQDIAFLETEIDCWIDGLLADGWDRLTRRVQQEGRKMESAIHERLAGIRISENDAAVALRSAGLAGKRPSEYPPEGRMQLAQALRQASKPIVIVLNKADIGKSLQVAGAIVASANAELALQKAQQAGLITYDGSTFEATGELSAAQQTGLQYIRDHVLAPLGETGVHKAIEAAVFDVLHLIPVYPVEDDKKLTDKEGRVLPDCHLVPPGTTAKQLAYRVHTDLGDKFVRGIDCRTKRIIGADHELQAGDVIKIAT